MAFIGVASVPIVMLTGFFSGAVMALYLTNFLSKYGATQFVGATVALTLTREIGPVLAHCGDQLGALLGVPGAEQRGLDFASVGSLEQPDGGFFVGGSDHAPAGARGNCRHESPLVGVGVVEQQIAGWWFAHH